MIPPTVGRVVWFHPNKNESFIATNGDQPVPALVAAVHPDLTINVGGFDANGNHFARQNVTLLQDDATPPEDGEQYAEWMPYQKAQAETAAS